MSSSTRPSPARFAPSPRLAGVALAGLLPLAALAAGTSEWVHPDASGQLVYKTSTTGDRIMDFSSTGYMGGGVALPEVPVRETVQPSGGSDDTAAIQAAIDRVAKLPLVDGFRGAVLLAPGTFTCGKTISISADGVVLRGSGAGADGASVIKMTGAKHNAFAISRTGAGGSAISPDHAESAAASKATGPVTRITDAYVPEGTSSFTVADAAGFAVGDSIVIRKPVTRAWIKFMHMDDMVRDGKAETWIKAGTLLTTERRIAAISGHTVTVDLPLADSFDARFLERPADGFAVAKITPTPRVTHAGLEHLRVESPPQNVMMTDAIYSGLHVNGEDCWVRDMVFNNTSNTAGMTGRRITLERVVVNHTLPTLGAAKPADFGLNASELLLDRCAGSGDNVFYAATGGGQAGPIVMLNCTFYGNGHIQPHQRWSTGLLVDNCAVPDGGIDYMNRGEMGSGHGWTMGWGVVWNSTAKEFVVQNPPGAANWVIGSTGFVKPTARPFERQPLLPNGIVDSPNTPVAPQSLYLAQLAARLGPQALKNIGYDSNSPAAFVHPSSVAGFSAHASAAPRGAGTDLGLHRPIDASNVREKSPKYSGENAVDGSPDTWWATDDGVTTGRLEIDLEGAVDIDTVTLAEPAALAGHITSYKVEGMSDSGYKLLAKGDTIGAAGQTAHFPKLTVWKVRLTILSAKAAPGIATFSLYDRSGN